MTEEEFMRLPDDGRKYELVDGQAKEVPISWEHDQIVVRFIGAIMSYVRGRGGMSIGKAGFRMRDGNIRCPDVSFTRKERIPGGRPGKWFGTVAPDFCVEIISPSEDAPDMARKVEEYFASGATLVWHIFPEAQQVMVYTSPTETVSYSAEHLLDAGDLLPGFSCLVS